MGNPDRDSKEAEGGLLDYFKRRIGVDLLMRMQAVDSVGRNLRNEDAEMVDDYKRQTNLLYGEGENNEDLGIQIEEESPMMVAGDNNNTTHHHYASPETSKPDVPQVELPKSVQPQVKKVNSLVQNLAMNALGAGILGAGIVIGNMNNDPVPPPFPPPLPEIVDTDTIGILQPDKE